MLEVVPAKDCERWGIGGCCEGTEPLLLLSMDCEGALGFGQRGMTGSWMAPGTSDAVRLPFLAAGPLLLVVVVTADTPSKLVETGVGNFSSGVASDRLREQQDRKGKAERQSGERGGMGEKKSSSQLRLCHEWNQGQSRLASEYARVRLGWLPGRATSLPREVLCDLK